MFELSRALAVHGDTGPVIGPCSVLVGSETDHGLDGKAHARLGHTDGLVLCVMRDVGSTVEQGVDSVTTVSLDGAASSVLGVLCDDRTIFSEKRVRLCDFDGLVQTFASGLDNAD